ncbi:hypothetical protein N665_1421s0001 [Sinapis alba]|nr:hypothetical protein N665_1421s0001 [Sinapis alba]
MKMLKGGIMILIITLSLLQMTSSVDVIREDLLAFGSKRMTPEGPNHEHNSYHVRENLFSFGSKRTTPAGPNAKHNSHHSLAHRHLIEVKGKNPGRSFNHIQKNAPHY